MRHLLIKFFLLTGDQRFQTGVDLTDGYLRKFNERDQFHLEKVFLPPTIPFELFCFYRFFLIPKYDGMSYTEYFSEHMFHFEDEFIFQQTEIDNMKLQYQFFQPIGAACARLFMMNMFGNDFDIIPLVNPIRYPQCMFVDYKNKWGKGNTAMFLSSQKKQYLLYIAPSFTHWLKQHIENLENNYY